MRGYWTQLYLKQLQSNPMRTKMLTSGTLAALQEIIASWIAHDRGKSGHYVNSRVPKMAIYGAFVSAPLGHVLIGLLQKIFSGRTSLKAKILQILVSNLVVSQPDDNPNDAAREIFMPYDDESLTDPGNGRYPQFKTPSISRRWQSSPAPERCIRSGPRSGLGSCRS